MRRLKDALIAAGFVHHAKSDTATCSFIASRLPFASVPTSIDLDVAHQWADQIKTCVGKLARDADGRLTGAAATLNQHRAAIFVELDLGTGRTVGVYGVHLHHINYNSTRNGCRHAEINAVLAHHHQHGDSAADATAGVGSNIPGGSNIQRAAVIVGDFNQARARDFQQQENVSFCAHCFRPTF